MFMLFENVDQSITSAYYRNYYHIDIVSRHITLIYTLHGKTKTCVSFAVSLAHGLVASISGFLGLISNISHTCFPAYTFKANLDVHGKPSKLALRCLLLHVFLH